MSRGVSPAKAGWAPVVAVGPSGAPPAPRELDETRTLPRELLLARARRLAWRAPSIPATCQSEPSRGQASDRPPTAPASETASSAGVPRPVGGIRLWLPRALRRRSRASGVLAGISAVLASLALGSLAPGDADGGTDPVELRALTPAPPVGVEPSVLPPTTPASEPPASDERVDEAALERRAADAIAEGRHADAARLHARLAELHPERPVHRAAARILGASARELAATDRGNVVWAGRGRDVR